MSWSLLMTESVWSGQEHQLLNLDYEQHCYHLIPIYP